jgi:hypothetical protein
MNALKNWKKLKTKQESNMNKELIKKDIEMYAGLESLKTLEGGKTLIKYLENSFVASLEELLHKYKTENNLIPIIAQIDEKLNLLRAITRSTKNKQLALNALKEEEEL